MVINANENGSQTGVVNLLRRQVVNLNRQRLVNLSGVSMYTQKKFYQKFQKIV